MTLTLSDDAQRIISGLLAAGRFSSAQEAVETAVRALAPLALCEFDPGEIDRLIAEGEASIEASGVIDAAQVFAEMRQLAARHREQSKVG
jgi:Arc/MetJ-type ribon-helix-helix transcriptional regulator